MSTFTIFLVLIIFICFLLVVAIMVQNPKGGGMSSTFGGGGGQQMGGVKKTTDFLDKSTWTLAVVLLVLILASNIPIMNGAGTDSTFEEDAVENVVPEATPEPTTDGADTE